MPEYYDQNGNLIIVGRRAEVVITCGETRKGKVILLHGDMVTIRVNITSQNPDGVLYTVAPTKVTMPQGTGAGL